MAHKDSIAVAYGDGIGPEIMQAVLQMLDAAGAELEIHPIEIGEKVYLQGEPSGITAASWDVLRSCKAFLKAPITTPQGGGFKSLNVTVRAALGLFANIRPCVSYTPFIKSHHPGMDLVIVRENEEDLYTGVEYQPTPGVFHALKTISRDGCERIIRYSFEYARSRARKKVTCFSKDNILKMTDGLFHQVFDEIAKEYPDIENEHWIVDIGSAKVADTPQAFDVIVTANLYGDILSDIAAQVAGSVGLAGSANIGTHYAMFEAIHGSAPRRAGQNMANPSGLLMGALLMLEHLGQEEAACRLYNAWACTIEEGIHTYDIFKESISKQRVGTNEFAKAVILRLGKEPQTLAKRKSQHIPMKWDFHLKKEQVSQRAIGIDLFIQSDNDYLKLAQKIHKALPPGFHLKLIANRGISVWPKAQPTAQLIDQWRCRIISEQIHHCPNWYNLTAQIASLGLEIGQAHLLYEYNGKPGFTLGQDDQ